MLTFPPHIDKRILLKPGVEDHPSEGFRREVEENGINAALFEKIIAKGNAKIQNIIIDEPAITSEMLSFLIRHGANKGVKNKAIQKLNSKSFTDKDE